MQTCPVDMCATELSDRCRDIVDLTNGLTNEDVAARGLTRHARARRGARVRQPAVRCSMRICVPMPISTSPPRSSAGRRKRVPIR